VKSDVRERNLGILIIIIVPLVLVLSLLFQAGIWTFPSALSRDVSLSDSHLCILSAGTCVALENKVFQSGDFEWVSVCTHYSSSEFTPLQLYLTPAEEEGILGYYQERLAEGNFEVCYPLKQLVDTWFTSDVTEKGLNPVHDGAMQSGQYIVLFKQGRDVLDELYFEVIE
jgi:hypothetical protein